MLVHAVSCKWLRRICVGMHSVRKVFDSLSVCWCAQWKWFLRSVHVRISSDMEVVHKWMRPLIGLYWCAHWTWFLGIVHVPIRSVVKLFIGMECFGGAVPWKCFIACVYVMLVRPGKVISTPCRCCICSVMQVVYTVGFGCAVPWKFSLCTC